MIDNAPSMAFAKKLIDAAYSILATATLKLGPKGGGEVDVLAVTLLARTVQNLKGVMTLAKVGLVVEARVLTRCCFENELWIAGLNAESAKFADRMLGDEVKSRQLRGELLFRAKGSRSTLKDDKGEKLRAWLQESKAAFPNAKMLSPKEVARGGTLEDAYVFYAQLSSDAAHPSLQALNRHIVTTKEDGEEIRGIDASPLPDPAEIEDTLIIACLAMLGCCIGVNQILDGTDGGKGLEALADEYRDIMGHGPKVRGIRVPKGVDEGVEAEEQEKPQ
jgi:hypothetical protein